MAVEASLNDYKEVYIAGGKTHTMHGKKAFEKIITAVRDVETLRLAHPLPAQREAWRAKKRPFEAAVAAGPVALSFSFA